MNTTVNISTNKSVVVVTGASGGIGFDIAIKFKKLGHAVVCLDTKPPPVEADLHYFFCDVSDEKNVNDVFAAIENKIGEVGILVNNCGIQYIAPIEEFPLEKWNQLIGVLLTGTFLCSKAAIPMLKKIAMKKNDKEKAEARIINISSIHGKVASPYKSAYVAAKHGVLGLAKVMALELGEYGITVNSICPGFVDTNLMRAQVQKQMELNELPESEVLSKVFLKDQCIKNLTQSTQVADLCLFLASESASTITGEAFNISGGWGMGV